MNQIRRGWLSGAMTLRLALLPALLLSVLSACDEKPAAAPPAAAAPAPAVPQKQPRMVSGAQAKEAVAAGATLLDVRTPDEFNDLHLPGAVNIPVQVLGGSLGSIPKDKPVVVYCAVGSRSAMAAVTLARAGYDVLNLGGIGNWNQ